MYNEKNEKSTNGNYRNGHETKKMKSSFGESEIKVPRDREGSFEPALIPKRMWLRKNKSSSFWMTVLTYLKARGVGDILITATDNLKGFTQTIRSVFPKSQTQICVVHQLRSISRITFKKNKN